MWASCPTELDAPVLVFGCETEDLMAGSVVMVFLNFVFASFLPILLLSGLSVWLVRRLKKGRAPGVLLHLMHHWDIMRIPGVLPVREAAYSPVTGDFDEA